MEGTYLIKHIGETEMLEHGSRAVCLGVLMPLKGLERDCE